MNQYALLDLVTEQDVPKYTYSSSLIPGFVAFFDVVIVLVSGLLLYLTTVGFSSYHFEYYFFAVCFTGFVGILMMQRAGLYQVIAIMRPIAQSDAVLIALATTFLLFLSVAFAFKASDLYSRLWLGAFGATSFGGIILGRIIASRVLKALSRRRVVGRTMVILGTGAQGQRFLERMSRVQPYFTTVTGVYDFGSDRPGGIVADLPVLGGIEDLIAAARRGEVDDVVIALPWTADRAVTAAVERLKELPVNVYISSDLVGFELAFRSAPGAFRQLPMFEVVQRPISGWSSVIKALEDYVLASLVVVMLAPLLLLIALLIKLDSPGPVFFRQPRLGFNNRRFDIIKFRSMYHMETPEHRVRQATKGDPRVTRIGRFIRATSLDELPQLFNVLNGTMSLVGPRPHALSHNKEFADEIHGYFGRHKVKPGITGWAQVRGLRGETDTPEKIRARVQHDLYYAENWSFLFDVRILVMTVVVVLFQKSAY